MGEVDKLIAWLKLHGNSAPWEEVEQHFRKAFPNKTCEPGTLKGLMLSNRGLPLFGKVSR